MNRGILVGAAVGVVALALGAVLLMRSESAADAGRPAPSAPVVSAPATVPAMPAPGAGAASGTVTGRAGSDLPAAPWNAPGGERPATGMPATPPVAVGRPGAPTLEEIQSRLQTLATSGQPSVREVDAVLADLQKNQGSDVVAGVNLQAVRDNLARTERIQQLAKEMQTLAAAPTAETPAQLQTRLAEMQRLQASMATNVVPAAGAAR